MPRVNIEDRRAYGRAYYLANRERVKARVKAYDAENSEAAKARNSAWQKNNRERCNENLRRWKENNPEEAAALARKRSLTRRARLLNQFIEDVDPRVVYEMHGGRCGICGQFIDGEFHVDHVVPLAAGGMHGYVNVQPAHPKCNLSKGARV